MKLKSADLPCKIHLDRNGELSLAPRVKFVYDLAARNDVIISIKQEYEDLISTDMEFRRLASESKILSEFEQEYKFGYAYLCWKYNCLASETQTMEMLNGTETELDNDIEALLMLYQLRVYTGNKRRDEEEYDRLELIILGGKQSKEAVSSKVTDSSLTKRSSLKKKSLMHSELSKADAKDWQGAGSEYYERTMARKCVGLPEEETDHSDGSSSNDSGSKDSGSKDFVSRILVSKEGLNDFVSSDAASSDSTSSGSTSSDSGSNELNQCVPYIGPYGKQAHSDDNLDSLGRDLEGLNLDAMPAELTTSEGDYKVDLNEDTFDSVSALSFVTDVGLSPYSNAVRRYNSYGLSNNRDDRSSKAARNLKKLFEPTELTELTKRYDMGHPSFQGQRV